MSAAAAHRACRHPAGGDQAGAVVAALCASTATGSGVVATGQHVDPRMYAEVFADLGCEPDAVWQLSGARATASVACSPTPSTRSPTDRPDAVLVLGDTYTAPLVAHGCPPRTVSASSPRGRACARSTTTSMEESNRRMVAALATVHLAPTELAAHFLAEEGVPADRVRVVGNPVLDALRASGVPAVPVDAAPRRTRHRTPGHERRRPRPGCTCWSAWCEELGRPARAGPVPAAPAHQGEARRARAARSAGAARRECTAPIRSLTSTCCGLWRPAAWPSPTAVACRRRPPGSACRSS